MKVKIIGVPLDLGADRRGVDMGPSAIRYAGLNSRLEALGLEVDDAGNIEVPVPESRDMNGQNPHLKYLKEIKQVSEDLADAVNKAREEGAFPLILGGDHSIAIGSVAGAAQSNRNMGILWFDAHGDFNTAQTTPTGNIHGMPLAVSVGVGEEGLIRCAGFTPKVKDSNVVIVGVRALDDGEKRRLHESQMKVFTMADIDELGIKEVMRLAINHLTKHASGVHLSFDMDVLDPVEAPGVGTPVKGGLTYREAHLALELLAKEKIVNSMDVVEVNPILDKGNKTAELAVEFILSALGKTIY